MKPQTQKKQTNSIKFSLLQQALSFFLSFLVCISFYSVLGVTDSAATAGINRTINFQGKIVNKTAGTNIANNSYSFTFKFYDAASGGTQLPSGAAWTETQSLTVTDGIFRATLGAVTPIPSTLNFNDDAIYLDITFNSEVFGSRVRMTAVPYALNAEKVGGLTVTNTTGTLTIPSAKTISFADAFTTSGANPLTLTTSGTTNVTLPTSGLLFGNSADLNFLDATTGTAYAINGSDATSGTNAGGSLTVRAGNASSSGTGGDLVLAGGTTSGGTAGAINLQTAGGTKWSVTSAGALTSTGAQTITTTTGALTLGADTIVGSGKYLRLTGGAGDPTATSGIVWYDTTANKFKVVENGTVKILCNTTDAGCGTGGSTLWSTIGNPSGNLALTMAAYTSTFTYNNATGSNNLFNLTDTTSNSGTGYLMNLTTATSSTLKPLHVSAAGVEALAVNASGNVGIGTTAPAGKLHVAGDTIVFGVGEGSSPTATTIRGAAAAGTDIAGAHMYFDASNGTGSGGSGALIFRTAPPTINAVPTFAQSATVSTVEGTVSSHTIPSVSTSGTNKVLVVEVAYRSGINTSASISSMTFGAQSMTSAGVRATGTGFPGHRISELWYLVNPGAGPSTVTMNFSQTVQEVAAKAVAYQNASQASTPYSTATSNSGSGGANPSVTITSASTELVVAVFSGYPGGNSVSTNAPAVERWNNVTTNIIGVGGETAGTTSTTYTWTQTGTGNDWAASAISLLPAGGSGINTMTEALRIDRYGNVGIGTTNPPSKLSVVTNTSNLTGKAAVSINQLEDQDIFTASASGLTRFTVNNRDITIGGHKNNVSAPGSANDIFVYDTAGDIDGGRWTQDDRALNSTWYNESLNSSTRGATRPFPRKAVLAATNDNLYIYDAKDNSLWMRFDQGTNFALDVAANNELTKVHALNGKIYVGTTGSSATGMYVIDFTKDKITRYTATDGRDFKGTISQRNTNIGSNGYLSQGTAGTLMALVNGTINDLMPAVINGKTYVAIATNGGTNGAVTILNETDRTVLANFGPASIPAKEIFLTPNGTLYTAIADSASPTNYALKVRYNITTASGNNVLFHVVYGNRGGTSNYGVTNLDNNTFSSLTFTAGPSPFDATFIPLSIYVTQGTSIIDAKSNTIYIGSTDNLSVIHEKQGDEVNGSIKYIGTTTMSTNLVGDVRAFYPLDTNVGSGLIDIMVRQNNLSNGGTAPTYNTTGVRNKGANLGASAATATTTSSSMLIPATTGLTVGAWVQPTTLTTTNNVREMWVSADANSAGVVSWGIGTKGDGTNANITCFAGNTGPTAFENGTGVAAVTNTWYYVVNTIDSSGNMKCYINGVLSATSTLTGTAQTPTRFQIGATQATTAMNAVRGNIDEVQVTAEVASPGVIKTNYDTALRALNGHAAITLRGTAITADKRQAFSNASSNTVNAVRADVESSRIYIATTNGGVAVMGMNSDTLNDVISTAATDDLGNAMGSTNTSSVSFGKGYGTNSFVAISHTSGIWIETIETNVKDFLANSYNPFGNTLSQSNLNVDSLFRVTNQASTHLDNLGNSSQPGITDILRVDQNGTYAGANIALGSRPDSTSSTIFNGLNQASGQFGADTNIRGATSSAIFKGKLFVGTRKDNAAGVYRYDGGGLWTLVVSAVGKVLSGDTANVDGFALTVWNNQLIVGTQTGPAGAQAGIFTSTNADTGTAATTTWTALNTTKGRLNTTTAIDGISDLAVYNGTLYAITDEPNAAEIYRYLGGTGTSVFTKVTSATAGIICTGDAADADGGMFAVANGRLYVGIRTASTTARVCWYDGAATNPDVTWTLVNTTRGRLGGYNGGASTTAMVDITGMTVFNGTLWVSAVKAANSMEIYRLKGNPTAAQADPFQRINQTVGKLVAADAANIDGAVLKTYQGRLYVGSQTGASTGAVYEYEQNNADNFVLINTTRGTFGPQTNVDDVTILQPYNDPNNPGGGAMLFMGTDDAGNVSGMYSWQKFLSQSYALRMDSGSQNLGSLLFTSDDQAVDNAGRSGKFVFSHGVNLSSGAFDYAEDYPTLDESIEAGDVVAVDPYNKEFVIKAAKNMPLVGVVSEDPGFRLQQREDKINGNKYIPIALVGRVPVKVSTENGEIKAGDYLTASSYYGAAMKATKAGAIIGQAMEDYNSEGQGKITVYVQTGQITGTALVSALPGLSTVEETTLTEMDGDVFGMRILKLLMKEQEKLDKDPKAKISEVFTDRVAATKEIIAPHIIADLITARRIKADSIEGLEIYTNKLSGLDQNLASLEAKFALMKEASTEAQKNEMVREATENLLVTGLDVQGNATVSASLHVWGSGMFDGILNVLDSITTPNLIVGRWADFVGTVIFRSDVNFFGRPTFNKDTAGYALIKKDAKTVTILFEKEYESMPVVNASLTLDEKLNSQGVPFDTLDQEKWIYEDGYTFFITKRSKKGFTIILNKPAKDDLAFSWAAFAVKDGKTSEGVSASGPVLTPLPNVTDTPLASPTAVLTE